MPCIYDGVGNKGLRVCAQAAGASSHVEAAAYVATKIA